MLELVIFDWDGTLMDSGRRIVHAMQHAYNVHERRPPADTAIRDIIGLDLMTAVERLSPGLGPRECARLAQQYRVEYARAHAIPTPLFRDAKRILADLEQRGLMLAVATGKSRAGLDRAVDEAGLAQHFVSTRCGEESQPKPHPGMLHDILGELATDAGDALMVGDTCYDLEMAAAAGVSALAVSFGAHSRERLLKWQPEIIIDALAELPEAIDRLRAGYA